MGKTMTSKEACAYAAQWGSYIRAGDPGACMYGFSPEDCRLQSEEHRRSCLDWIDNHCVPAVQADPSRFDADELKKLAALREYLAQAPVLES